MAYSCNCLISRSIDKIERKKNVLRCSDLDITRKQS